MRNTLTKPIAMRSNEFFTSGIGFDIGNTLEI
jgi:hypothetical protein